MCFKSTFSVISWQTTFIPDDVTVLCILMCHSVVLAHVFLVSLLKRVYVHNIWSLGFEKGEVKLSRRFDLTAVCYCGEKDEVILTFTVWHSRTTTINDSKVQKSTSEMFDLTFDDTESPSTTLNLTFVDVHGIDVVGVALAVALLQHLISIPNSVI